MTRRLLAYLARRAARVWVTGPLRAADAWTLWRRGETQLAVVRVRQRPPSRDS